MPTDQEIVAGWRQFMGQWREAVEYLRGRVEGRPCPLLTDWDGIIKEIDNA